MSLEQGKMRPVLYGFDPVRSHVPHQDGDLTFHLLTDSSTRLALGFENCNKVNPRSLGVPWPTSFPAALQCKHWQVAEEAARGLMHEICTNLSHERGLLPQGMEELGTAIRQQKLEELIETAVTAPINMFPAANPTKARVMAKANLLIFMHDDVIESYSSTTGATIIDDAFLDMQLHTETTEELQDVKWRNKIFKNFILEAINTDTEKGKELVEGILSWVKHTRSQAMPELQFTCWDDYINYRIGDFAVEFCEAAIKYTCEISLPPHEMQPLNRLRRLWMTHFSLTNDIYSYQKELLESENSGTALINAVKLLEKILHITTNGAKQVLRGILIDLERQIDQEYSTLLKSGALDERQSKFADGMIICLAGNCFYSATTYRYARAVQGSLLADQAQQDS